MTSRRKRSILALQLVSSTLDGTKIFRENWGSNTLIPLYDNEDSVCGILYNSTPYYFIKNLQGDVIAIVNANAETVARYSYDAWGVCTITEDTTSCNIATLNPYRYRSYYYDEEIGLYYLQSRYYDPEVGRFLNSDACEMINITTPNKTNLMAYCNNNPINNFDPSGFGVMSLGIEGQAAFVFGVYVGIAINMDQSFNIALTTSIGFAIITNATAYVQAYIARYYNKYSARSLRGWGVSLGAAFSAGAHISAGGTLDIGFGSLSGNVSIGYGWGVSLAPVPYFQVRVGYTSVIYSDNLRSALKKYFSITKNIVGIRISITSNRKNLKIYIHNLRRTITVTQRSFLLR